MSDQTPPSPRSERPRQDELPEFRGTLTHANLKAAYGDDARSSQLYLYFARIARIEGYPEVARLLLDLAESETFYAHGHLDFLKRAGDPVTGLAVGETASNLRAALAAEAAVTADPLDDMARTAHAEGFPDIASWFESLGRARRAHAGRLREALGQVEEDER